MRILSLVAVMVALLLVALLSKRQLDTVQAPRPAQAASAVHTPAQARQVSQQVQDDINRISQERSKQLEQNLERSEP